MVKVICVRVFVDPREVGRIWEFASLVDAENSLGWFFVHNNCDVKG